MQMYDIVATGVLGLLVGFWSGRSIRWKMEETEETGEDREERKNTAARQLVREGVTIGSPVNGEIRKRMEETAEETADAWNWLYQHCARGWKGLCAHGQERY